MNEAIKIAIEKGGYSFPDLENNIVVASNARVFGKATAHKMQLAYIAQDPLFWQALGKALGWGSSCNICLKDSITHSYANGWADECKNPKQHLTKNHKAPWLIEAHRYFDLLLTGGETEKFWKEIIYNKT